MNLYIITGFLLGFLFYILIDRGEKQRPLIFNSIIISCMNTKYHIHHWIIFLLLLIILIPIIFIYSYNNIFALLLGICLGSILQGLSYNDAFKIIVK